MSKELQQANKNIIYLVSEIVNMKRVASDQYCCNSEAYLSKTCDENCRKCKDKFYEDMKQEMIKRYCVSLKTE